MNFYIKIGVPNYREIKNWGDYHFASAIKRSLELKGHRVTIQILPDWDDPADSDSDVTIHLMGLSRYKPKKGPLNVLWLISHPEKVFSLDLNSYDLITVASRPFASKLNNKLPQPVYELLQFYDSELMFPEPSPELSSDITFVGNSRKVFRQIIKDLMPCPYQLSIWGRHWDMFIDKEYIKGDYFPYEDLRRLYSSAAVNLNDHWQDMRQHGFVNNRVFDILACGGFLISDYVDEIQALLPDCLVMYRNENDLKDKIDYFLAHEDERQQLSKNGLDRVSGSFHVDTRVNQLLDILDRHEAKPKTNIIYSWAKRLLKRTL